MPTDEDDDFDPLAPCHYTSELDETEVEDATDGGFCDGRKVVRVWLEDGRLTKVRVSPTWATKLQGQHLSDSFRQALAIASVSVAEVPDISPEAPIVVPAETVPALTDATLAELVSMFADVERRWSDAIAETPPMPSPAPTTARSEGVTVTLGASGRAKTVDFTDAWLDEASAGDICAHVMRAAEKAYTRFTPHPKTPDALDDLRQEQRVLQAVLRSMLNPEG